MYYSGTDEDIIGRFGEKIVKELWPEFINVNEEKAATYLDMKGIDGWLRKQPVQVKTDKNIAIKGNFYKEHYKKTFGYSQDTSSVPWRISPFYAEYHIFVPDYKEYIVSVDAFARAAIGRPLSKIRPTSLGILVPMSTVDIKEERDHPYSVAEIGT